MFSCLNFSCLAIKYEFHFTHVNINEKEVGITLLISNKINIKVKNIIKKKRGSLSNDKSSNHEDTEKIGRRAAERKCGKEYGSSKPPHTSPTSSR